jgi:hypothetical protein
MTLEQAINHCLEVAGSCETACELQHKQLADWLKELREFKENPVGYIRPDQIGVTDESSK